MKIKSWGSLILILIIVILGLIGYKVVLGKFLPWGKGKTDGVNPSKTINTELYSAIEEYGKANKIEPIDAMIDRVWKAIPGYNGLAVDIDASYSNMESGGRFEESLIIYKEVAPDIRLEDLPPEPIYRGNPQKTMAAFLINVAWGNEYIPKILEVLDNHQIKSTFFFDGSWVKKNPDLAKKIWTAGHEIGNHAYSHPDLSRYSTSQTREEIEKTNHIIEETLGVKAIWFAPPSGSFNDNTIQVAHELNMKTILWTVDTVDWRKPDTGEMVNRVLSKVEKGTMILMHPTRSTADGIDAMIRGIKEKGLQLGTVSQLMDEKRID